MVLKALMWVGIRKTPVPDLAVDLQHCLEPFPSSWGVGSYQPHLITLRFISPWIITSYTYTDRATRTRGCTKSTPRRGNDRMVLQPVPGPRCMVVTSPWCAVVTSLQFIFPVGLLPGSELEWHESCFGNKLLNILFFLAAIRVAPGLICMLAKPYSQILIS